MLSLVYESLFLENSLLKPMSNGEKNESEGGGVPKCAERHDGEIFPLS